MSSTPTRQERELIIFHGGCPDGFGAAWWLGRALGECDLHEGRYGDPPPDCTGRDVWLVDFSYPTAELEQIAGQAKTVTMLDHHQTSVGYVAALTGWDVQDTIGGFCDLMELGPGRCVAVVDQRHSGVGLVAEYVRRWKGTPGPRFLGNIQDRDLWRWQMPDTADVFAAVTSRPYTVEAWDEVADLPHAQLVAEGQAINRYRDSIIEHCVANARQVTLFGCEVWAAACPYHVGSDVAGRLAERDPEGFAAYWIVGPEYVQWGLRSADDGADVAALAETVGGGGHRHASGFRTSIADGLRIIGGRL